MTKTQVVKTQALPRVQFTHDLHTQISNNLVAFMYRIEGVSIV